MYLSLHTGKTLPRVPVMFFFRAPIPFLGRVTVRQASNQGGRRGAKPTLENVSLPLEKCVGHSSKNLGTSRKTLRPSWCPKLVTGLPYVPHRSDRDPDSSSLWARAPVLNFLVYYL